uniref:NADH-ubiquinone oxidoreductase chain 4 n=1 Tax=Syllis sp. JYC-2022 TaxID=2928755 RepID=A0A976RW63_9ANNE|nr:NADH dehydrogenase subunit 4 [Syllis sp. JYC-2022]
MMLPTLTLMMLMYVTSWSTMTLFIPFIMLYTLTFLFSPMMTPITLSPMMSLDSMSVLLVVLTLWITNLMLITSLKIKHYFSNPSMFTSSVISLTIILMLSFSVNAMLPFYIMFEASLIPTFIIVLVWGYQPERLEAGMYLMLYTVTASLPLLASLMTLHLTSYSTMYFSPPCLTNTNIFLSLSLMMAFLVKMPMYLTHLWLPKAHVEAPVAGSMILASILLKLGGYGMLRMISIIPQSATALDHLIIPISVSGATLTSILCMRQIDMKSMIAYSSVSHMAFVITGIFTMTKWGWEGALMMMLAHGLISSGLFAAANMYYENTNSRSLMLNTGMTMVMPTMTMWWFLMIAGNMAAPPFMNLIGEMVLISSAAAFSTYSPPILVMCSFFTACYSMILYTNMHHGALKKSTNSLSTLSIYFSVMALHVMPPLFLVLMSSQMMSWT